MSGSTLIHNSCRRRLSLVKQSSILLPLLLLKDATAPSVAITMTQQNDALSFCRRLYACSKCNAEGHPAYQCKASSSKPTHFVSSVFVAQSYSFPLLISHSNTRIADFFTPFIY